MSRRPYLYFRAHLIEADQKDREELLKILESDQINYDIDNYGF